MNTAVRAIPKRLYLFNVSDCEKVSGVFNGSICYALNWTSVLYSVYSNSDDASSASMESDERMLRCIWMLLKSFGTHLKPEPDRQDIVVVNNPEQKYVDTQRVWLDYSLAVYVQGAKHARQL